MSTAETLSNKAEQMISSASSGVQEPFSAELREMTALLVLVVVGEAEAVAAAGRCLNFASVAQTGYWLGVMRMPAM